MSSALGKEMFDKFIDSNNDGAASLEEIQMVVRERVKGGGDN